MASQTHYYQHKDILMDSGRKRTHDDDTTDFSPLHVEREGNSELLRRNNAEANLIEYRRRTREKKELRIALYGNALWELIAGMFDGLVLAAIFSAFLTKTTEAMLHVWGRFVLFPLAVVANVKLAYHAWRKFYIDGRSSSRLAAIMQTLFTIPIAIAIAGSLALPATAFFPTVIAPLMFAVTLGVKALFQFSVAIHCLIKSGHGKEHQQEKLLRSAKANAVFGLSTTLAIPGILGVFLYAQAAFAPFAIVAGVLGAAYAAYLYYTHPSLDDVLDYPDSDNDEEFHDDAEADLEHGHGHGHRRQRQRDVRYEHNGERAHDEAHGHDDDEVEEEEEEEEEVEEDEDQVVKVEGQDTRRSKEVDYRLPAAAFQPPPPSSATSSLSTSSVHQKLSATSTPTPARGPSSASSSSSSPAAAYQQPGRQFPTPLTANQKPGQFGQSPSPSSSASARPPTSPSSFLQSSTAPRPSPVNDGSAAPAAPVTITHSEDALRRRKP
jgi:hypothetical protein